MAIPTIPEAIARGDVSIYLSGNDNSVGELFGGRRAAPKSQATIAMITDALRWGYNSGSSGQTSKSLRATADYLIWLTGMYGQQAQAILQGSGGGSIIPGGGSLTNIYPFFIHSSNFESDGVTYLDSRIAGDTLSIFIDEYTQQFFLSENSFTYVAGGGFTIILGGFDANNFDYTIRVEKIYPL